MIYDDSIGDCASRDIKDGPTLCLLKFGYGCHTRRCLNLYRICIENDHWSDMDEFGIMMFFPADSGAKG